jgi:hypothetical protein
MLFLGRDEPGRKKRKLIKQNQPIASLNDVAFFKIMRQNNQIDHFTEVSFVLDCIC